MNVAFFHSDLSLENWQSLIDSFQNMKEKDFDFDILIETTEVLETDYTLHHTFQVILMKFNYIIEIKQQTFFKSVNMIKSQRRCKHINFILWNSMLKNLLEIIKRDVRFFKIIIIIIIIINSYILVTSIRSTHEKLYAICIE